MGYGKSKFTADMNGIEATNLLAEEIFNLPKNEQDTPFLLMRVQSDKREQLAYAAAHINQPIGSAMITYINTRK